MTRLDTILSTRPHITNIKNNSECNNIEFKDASGNPVIYTLETLYKLGKFYIVGIIRRNDNNVKYLVEVDSIRYMIRLGYIENVMVQSTGYIKHHRHKGLDNFNVVYFESEKRNEFCSEVEHLTSIFDHTYVIDNKDIEPIGWYRLLPEKAIFDLSGSLCGLVMTNEFEEIVVTLTEYRVMSSPQYCKGKFSPESESPNYHRILEYIALSNIKSEEIKAKLSSEESEIIEEISKLTYMIRRPNFTRISINMAKLIFGAENVYYAVPKPQCFKSERLFEICTRRLSNILTSSDDFDKYELVRCDSFNESKAIKILLNKFKLLSSGNYLEKHKGIVDYVNKSIAEIATENEEFITSKVYKLIEMHNKGLDVTDEITKLNLKIYNDRLNTEETLSKFLRNEITAEEFEQFDKVPTFEEIVEAFGLEYLIKKDVSTETEIAGDTSVVETPTKDITEDTADKKVEETTKADVSNESNDQTYIFDTVYIDDNPKYRIDVVSNNDETVYCILRINEDSIKISNSECSIKQYVDKGLDLDTLKGPLNRLMKLYRIKTDVQKVLDELQ